MLYQETMLMLCHSDFMEELMTVFEFDLVQSYDFDNQTLTLTSQTLTLTIQTLTLTSQTLTLTSETLTLTNKFNFDVFYV
jgi:hypothetical protein